MIKHFKYLSYVLRHKWFVFVAGLKTGAPLWRLIIHDYSKFSRAEWVGYVNRFYGGRAGLEDKELDPDEFHIAWTHHWHNNPHHWEHWLVIKKGELTPVPMPAHFIREMVADWMGAGRAITGHWDIKEWYQKNYANMKLHPLTQIYLTRVLAGLGVFND